MSPRLKTEAAVVKEMVTVGLRFGRRYEQTSREFSSAQRPSLGACGAGDSLGAAGGSSTVSSNHQRTGTWSAVSMDQGAMATWVRQLRSRQRSDLSIHSPAMLPRKSRAGGEKRGHSQKHFCE